MAPQMMTITIVLTISPIMVCSLKHDDNFANYQRQKAVREMSGVFGVRVIEALFIFVYLACGVFWPFNKIILRACCNPLAVDIADIPCIVQMMIGVLNRNSEFFFRVFRGRGQSRKDALLLFLGFFNIWGDQIPVFHLVLLTFIIQQIGFFCYRNQ